MLGRVVGETVEKKLLPSVGRAAADAFQEVVYTYERAATSARQMLKHLGAEELASKMDVVDREAKLKAGADVDKMHQILAPFAAKGPMVKYNQGDLAHVVDLMEGATIRPKSMVHKQVADQLSQLLDRYADEAESSGLRMYSGATYEAVRNKMLKKGLDRDQANAAAAKAAKRPFMRRVNYFPHYFDEHTIAQYLDGKSAMHNQSVDMILDQGLAASRDEAKVVLTRMLRAPGEFRGGVLQHVRDLELPGYDKDITRVLPRYFFASTRRIETAKMFGATDKEALRALGQIDSKYLKAAKNVYRSWAGDVDPDYRDLARFTNTIHAVTMLSTSGIVQPAQLINTMARIGWNNTLDALSVVAKDWRKEKMWAQSTGAVFDSIHAELMPDSFGSLSETWSKLIGLDSLDRFNRVVSAVGGRLWAQKTVEDIAKSPELGKRWAADFAKMGIDLDGVLQRGGQLSPEELRRAGLFTANNTQFATSVLDMPEFRATPQGRFMYLFKSFAFQQGRFIKDEIIKPLVDHGDMRPWITFATASAVLGPVMGETIRHIKAREPSENDVFRVAEDVAMVGAFGMFFDAFRAMNSGPSAIFNWILGPTAGEAAQVLGSDIPALARPVIQGEGGPDFEPLVRHLTGRVPGIGQWLRNTVMPVE